MAARPDESSAAPAVQALVSFLEHENDPMIALDTDDLVLAANGA